jgi:hypothetical protein
VGADQGAPHQVFDRKVGNEKHHGDLEPCAS